MHYSDLISRANADYVDQLYLKYQADPHSVEEYWQAFFAGFDLGGNRSGESPAAGLTTKSASNGTSATAETRPAHFQGDAAASDSGTLGVECADLVHSYRELGHILANLDPLGHNRPSHPLLELAEFGLTLNDLDRECGRGGFQGPSNGTVRDMLAKLRETYCGTIGVQYMDIANKTQREWLQQRMEPILNKPVLSAADRKSLLYQIVAAQGFEEYLHATYIGVKRFSLEGSETLIPLLNTLAEEGSNLGVDEIVMGMAHRGRLNTLAHVMNKPYETILGEFEGTVMPADNEGDGDVKYHMGYSQDRVMPNGRKLHIALSFNPSHLELVNPVVEGIVRGKQYHLGDEKRSKVVPILIHGDAAFTGQGIVLETLCVEMPFWRTGGTIHVIINNQIGFTTMPKQGRFTPYPTDVAKTIQAPIFHVNADDPEAVVHVSKLAIAFRQEFHCDVMIDLYCYRRWGHNEGDDAVFTQPKMYKEIANHARVRELYGEKLVTEGKIAQEDVDAMKKTSRERLEKARTQAQEVRPRQAFQAFGGIWKGMTRSTGDWSAKTGVAVDLLKKVGAALSKFPENFTVYPKLARILHDRADAFQGKRLLDWGAAEALALGSLLVEGTPIRFVGQDAQRGTFSHRHACLHDFNTGEKYYPLANLAEASGLKASDFIIVNTMLSELAVLGFEYGFSSSDPRNLCVWEAQFGDFVNGAQAIIDQFIAASESKWQKFCGLVMLLPHGYEGQGPEHSNAYIERFLSLCAENNMQVCQPTLPSQYFHLLRRQIKRTFRKPLITFMPKSLLRAEASTSRLEDLAEGTFQLVLDDPANPPRERVRRLLLCSGKAFFALHARRNKEKLDDVAIVRVEQMYPFPQKELLAIFQKYRAATEVVWVQDEPRNRGAWTFMQPRLEAMLPETAVLSYVGRDEAASPATGSYKVHEQEAEHILSQALDLVSRQPKEVAATVTAAPATPTKP